MAGCGLLDERSSNLAYIPQPATFLATSYRPSLPVDPDNSGKHYRWQTFFLFHNHPI
jgi:hypothetical protein